MFDREVLLIFNTDKNGSTITYVFNIVDDHVGGEYQTLRMIRKVTWDQLIDKYDIYYPTDAQKNDPDSYFGMDWQGRWRPKGELQVRWDGKWLPTKA